MFGGSGGIHAHQVEIDGSYNQIELSNNVLFVNKMPTNGEKYW